METQCLALIALGSPHGSIVTNRVKKTNRVTESSMAKLEDQQLNFDKISDSIGYTGQLWKLIGFSGGLDYSQPKRSRTPRTGNDHCSE
jgi:hypothetical protein